MTKRRVLRRTRDGKMSLHADLKDIAGFHCNDMVVDAAGRAYVGNFGFDLDAELLARGAESVIADHHDREVFACVAPDGTVRVAAERTCIFPNGSGVGSRRTAKR